MLWGSTGMSGWWSVLTSSREMSIALHQAGSRGIMTGNIFSTICGYNYEEILSGTESQDRGIKKLLKMMQLKSYKWEGREHYTDVT